MKTLSAEQTERFLAYLEGNLPETERRQVETDLKEDSALAEAFVALSQEEAILSDWAASSRVIVSLDEAAFGEGEQPGDGSYNHVSTSTSTKPASPHPAWALAAAACVVAGFSLWWGLRQQSAIQRYVATHTTPTGEMADNPWAVSAESPTSPPANDGLAALLVNDAGASFAPSEAPDGVQFRSGSYHLEQGAAHLRFVNGVDLVFRAPTRFRVETPFRIALQEGSMRAMVPDSGHGFTIAAPDFDFEDLGTEFGVSVDPTEGRSSLHVFEGEVKVNRAHTQESVRSVHLGESITARQGSLTNGSDVAADSFPTPQSIGFDRWQLWSQSLRQDPDVFLYYPFERDPSDPTTESIMANSARHGDPLPARVEGARWVTGRWPGKEALLFDRDGDFVEFGLPEPLGSFTMAFWIKIDRLDYELSAVMDSNDWEPGDLHLQVARRDRAFRFGAFDRTSPVRQTGAETPLGVWALFSVVCDREAGTATTYVNGELTSSCELGPEVVIRPGTVRLGDWLRRPDWDSTPKRGLRGRIDEVIMWQRPLSTEELEKVIEAGRPEILWPLPAPPSLSHGPDSPDKPTTPFSTASSSNS